MSQEKSRKKGRERQEGEGRAPQSVAEKAFLSLLCASSIVFILLVTFYQPFRVIGIGIPPPPLPQPFSLPTLSSYFAPWNCTGFIQVATQRNLLGRT